ncbi:MAG: hypothetical protein JXQ25_03565 [Deltaproteobacteria bacterium]|nr:hypothetical protein [Deltaproteobacteria bacterium]
MRRTIFEEMKERWPSAVIARTEIEKFTGGALSEKYLSNLDSLGRGPSGRFYMGRRVMYPIDSLLSWLEGRSKKI